MGVRTITYFVFDLRSGDFAPSKFCAYIPVPMGADVGRALHGHPITTAMTVRLYATLGGEPTFEGGWPTGISRGISA